MQGGKLNQLTCKVGGRVKIGVELEVLRGKFQKTARSKGIYGRFQNGRYDSTATQQASIRKDTLGWQWGQGANIF